MFNFVNENTQFVVQFTAYEIESIRQSLRNLMMASRDHDTIQLCIALISAFDRTLNN